MQTYECGTHPSETVISRELNDAVNNSGRPRFRVDLSIIENTGTIPIYLSNMFILLLIDGQSFSFPIFNIYLSSINYSLPCIIFPRFLIICLAYLFSILLSVIENYRQRVSTSTYNRQTRQNLHRDRFNARIILATMYVRI